MRNKFLDHVSVLDSIIRFSNKRFVHPRSVASHLFTVAHMVLLIGDQENLRDERKDNQIDMEMAVRKAISHDLPEALTGDIISPIKHYDETFNQKIHEIEQYVTQKEILKYLPVALQEKYADVILNCKEGVEGRLVAMCDLMDILLYCSDEKVLGNRSKWLSDVFFSVEESVSGFLSEFPCARKYFNHFRETFMNPQGNKCGEESSDESNE